MSHSPLIFLQLNEVNFDVLKNYINKHDDLPAFTRLLSNFQAIETHGESRYEELEPWIQWVSAQTGKTFAEHGVFRLGDIVNKSEDLVQIFETLEAQGLLVGAISPMNARNRLKNPAYFIPDPWTDTPSDGSGFSRRLTQMLRQTVNDNAAGKISARSLATVLEGIIKSFTPSGTMGLFALILGARSKPWNKALVLDQLLHLIHRRLLVTAKPDVSFVFLNAGAHIQHHYFFNAEGQQGSSRNPSWYVKPEADPVRDMLHAYDKIVADYLKFHDKGARLILATGLTQVPYNSVKFYYRLKDHAKFLSKAGILFDRVLPRMTRDFEVHFPNEAYAREAAHELGGMHMVRDDLKIFGEIEIRGRSVFATLTYPNEIHAEDTVRSGELSIERFGEMLSFVAIKNGMHSSRGYAFLSPNCPGSVPTEPIHVGKLFEITQQCCSAAAHP